MENIYSYEIDQCQLNPDMDSYATFAEIPEGRVSESSLIAWLVSGGDLEQIPDDLRTEPVLWTAVRHSPHAYDLITPGSVSDHRGLSIEAMRQGNTDFKSVPDEHKDEQFLIDVTISGTQSIFDARLNEYYPHLITERVVRTICSRSVSQAFDFVLAAGEKASSLLKDEYLEEAIKTQVTDFVRLHAMGKEYLLIKMLAFGFWPHKKNFTVPNEVQAFRTPPANPHDALARIQVAKGAGYDILHRCWLKTLPVKEVVDALQGSHKGLNELFDIYPEKIMREHMKSHRSIRGRFLEHELGA